MSDLQDLSTQALSELLQNLTSAKGFILSQAPDYCQQLIAWKIYGGYIFSLCSLIIVTSLLTSALIFHKRRIEELAFTFFTVSFLAIFLLGIPSVILLSEAVKATIAPKVVLVEHITELMNGGKR